MNIEVTGFGGGRNVVVDGRQIDEEYAYGYATQNQGYAGTFIEWLNMPADERKDFELAAAGWRSSRRHSVKDS